VICATVSTLEVTVEEVAHQGGDQVAVFLQREVPGVEQLEKAGALSRRGPALSAELPGVALGPRWEAEPLRWNTCSALQSNSSIDNRDSANEKAARLAPDGFRASQQDGEDADRLLRTSDAGRR
jgi:hypothetical protein